MDLRIFAVRIIWTDIDKILLKLYNLRNQIIFKPYSAAEGRQV